MDLKSVKKFIELAKKEGVSSLKYEAEDIKLSVTLPGYNQHTQFVGQTPFATQPSSGDNRDALKETAKKSDHYEVISPLVGTFYESSSPGDPAFVKVGDKVSKGQTLCIVEAMKIMNEVESEVNGEIVEIVVDNESLVEYGQILFRVKVN